MTLAQAIAAAGMTPPNRITPGRWVRFPGIAKNKSNRAGWCRVISPTLAIFGDWSSGLTEVWRDVAHQDDEASRKALREARAREQRFAAQQRALHLEGARRAQELLDAAVQSTHPYLEKKGFSHLTGLVFGGHLLIPVRDVRDDRLISLQQISADGDKRFLHGARAKGGVFRLGGGERAILCEGYATGLSIQCAARRLYRALSVIVCFSAGNIEVVAHDFPRALIAADHDESGTGERIAKRTGLKWVMPPGIGDFNDLMVADGIHAVVQVLRGTHR